LKASRAARRPVYALRDMGTSEARRRLDAWAATISNQNG
jgi:hypothetical protein